MSSIVLDTSVWIEYFRANKFFTVRIKDPNHHRKSRSGFYAINDKRVLDYEDGLDYFSVVVQGCEVIITEDLDGFYFSEIEMFDCKSFIRIHFNEKSL